jgi:CheY-like chemotaxis protein
VATAGGAREGLKLVEAGRFDVLVTDLTMPHDDGYWLLDRVRAMLGEIPVVSISGVATHRTAVLGAGFDAFLRKPVEPDELVGVVALLSGRAAA